VLWPAIEFGGSAVEVDVGHGFELDGFVDASELGFGEPEAGVGDGDVGFGHLDGGLSGDEIGLVLGVVEGEEFRALLDDGAGLKVDAGDDAREFVAHGDRAEGEHGAHEA
jgi:hypothetical protein